MGKGRVESGEYVCDSSAQEAEAGASSLRASLSCTDPVSNRQSSADTCLTHTTKQVPNLQMKQASCLQEIIVLLVCFLCVHSFSWYMCVEVPNPCTCMSLRVGTVGQPWCVPYRLSILVFETRPLNAVELMGPAQLATQQAPGLLISGFPALRQTGALPHSFVRLSLCEHWGLHSGPHACRSA